MTPAGRADPFPLYAAAHKLGSVSAVTDGLFLVSGYAAVNQVLREPGFGLAEPGSPNSGNDALRLMNQSILRANPPDHGRMRSLISKVFTPRRVAELRPAIEAAVDDLLDQFAEAAVAGGPVDFMDRVAYPLPVTVICELLGVPAADRNDFRRWSKAIVSSVPADVARESTRSVSAYLTALIDAKRVSPAHDLLSDLVHQTSGDGILWPDELVRMAFLLLVAGLEKMVGLIGNGVLALLQHPRELARLRAQPGLMPAAIEEFLRYQGAIHIAAVRFTTEPVRVAGTVIPADELVLISLLAANRDRDRYADPDVLDLSRRPQGHLAFGHGVHYCVGAPLARLEGQIAIGRLLGRLPDLALAGPPGDLHWRGSLLVRSLSSLPVTLG